MIHGWLHLRRLALVTALPLGLYGAAPSVPPEMALSALPARAPEPAGNSGTPATVDLGRLLFFDPILSATGDVACATCHHPAHGWADGRAIPIGVGGDGIGPARLPRSGDRVRVLDRNAPSLVNVGFNGLVSGRTPDPERAPMFWDSRTDGLEAQVAFPIRAREEMRGESCAEGEAVARAVERVGRIPEYRERFGAAFDAPTATAVTPLHLARAIAAFERSLVASESPFDRFMRGDPGALAPVQRDGLREFQDAGCSHCHGGPMFSDFKLHVIGVPDAGLGTAPRGRQAFRTPSLRQLRDSAPFMHNGRFRSLDEVLQFYEELMDAAGETLDGGDASAKPPLDPLLRHLHIRSDRIPALRAFLEALHDDHYDRSIPATVPSGLTVGGR